MPRRHEHRQRGLHREPEGKEPQQQSAVSPVSSRTYGCCGCSDRLCLGYGGELRHLCGLGHELLLRLDLCLQNGGGKCLDGSFHQGDRLGLGHKLLFCLSGGDSDRDGLGLTLSLGTSSA